MATKKKTVKRKAVRRLPMVRVELDPIEREMKALQLEELRMSVGQRRAMAEMRKQNSASQELQLRKSREDQCRIQRACNHRKGGKDRAGIGNGQDSDYSVIKHTYANMDMCVMCQRCQMEWRPGTTEIRLHSGERNHTGISYATALAWPTDNEPSSATFFLIPTSDSALVQQVAALKAQLASLTQTAAHAH